MILTMISVIASLGLTSVYFSRRLKKILDTFKDVYQGLLCCVDILNCLTNFDVKLGLRRGDKLLTWRRTPAPAKITVAGEKTYMAIVTL